MRSLANSWVNQNHQLRPQENHPSNSANLSVFVCFSSNKHTELMLRKINSSDSVVDRSSVIWILCLTLGQTCTIPCNKYLYCCQLFCFAFQHLSFMMKAALIHCDCSLSRFAQIIKCKQRPFQPFPCSVIISSENNNRRLFPSTHSVSNIWCCIGFDCDVLKFSFINQCWHYEQLIYVWEGA